MITPSCPPANTEVGLDAQTASNDTSVSPCQSIPHVFAGLPAATTVTVDVALLAPSVAVTVALPVATPVSVPDEVTVSLVGSDTVHFGVSPSTRVPSAFRPTKESDAVAPTSTYAEAGTISTDATPAPGRTGSSSWQAPAMRQRRPSVANNAARAARMRAARSARRTTGNKGDWVDLTAKDCIPAALRS
jgi:hypothetical protein